MEPTSGESSESLAAAALALVASLPEPLAAAAIKAQWKARLGWKPKQITAVWNDLRASGQLQAWPGSLWWTRSLAAAVESRVLDLAGGQAWDLPGLVAAACPHPKALAKSKTIVNGLVKSGRLRSRKLGKVTYIYAGMPGLIDLLLQENGLTREDLRRYLSAGDGSNVSTTAATPAAAADLSEALPAAVRRMQASPGAPVSLPQLRAAFPLTEKAEFDRAVLALADEQQVYLAQHDHGWALPEAERDLLVHDGGTRLYVAITLRD